jgi:hypothetical protein
MNGKGKRLYSAERKMLELKGAAVPENNVPVAGASSSVDLSEFLDAIAELKGMIQPSHVK